MTPLNAMPVLPIPMIISLVLLGFLAHRLAGRRTHPTLLGLIAICALQSAIIALVQYYGVTNLRPVQPLLAMAIPPVAWFAFSWASGGDTAWRQRLWHASGPLAAVAALAISPMLLDLLIPVTFTAYGLAMLIRMRRGEDSLPHARLDGGGIALVAWRIVAVALIASAACDVLIAYGLATGQAGNLLWVPSLVSSLSLLSLGALSLSSAMETHREAEPAHRERSAEDIGREQAIVARLDGLMQGQKAYLDPDLTLARLSRKLVIPAKQLSASINRVKGVNVSRYINDLRIAEACDLLAAGRPVTSVIYDSGFNTKSNFNREFLRVKGMPPSQWVEERDAGLQPPPDCTS